MLLGRSCARRSWELGSSTSNNSYQEMDYSFHVMDHKALPKATKLRGGNVQSPSCFLAAQEAVFTETLLYRVNLHNHSSSSCGKPRQGNAYPRPARDEGW